MKLDCIYVVISACSFFFPTLLSDEFWCLVIGQSQNVSCVAVSERGGCGRGQRSRQSVLGSSELSGARLRGRRDGNVLTATRASSSSSSSCDEC